MILLAIIIVIITFLSTRILISKWIPKAERAGLVGKDMHKRNNPRIPEIGGLPVISGFLIGLFWYIGYLTFKPISSINPYPLLALIVSTMTAAIIGLVDDALGWKIGLRIRYKIMLTFFIAVPIMILNLGNNTMHLPFYGPIHFGIVYPLLIIPLGIMGAANGFNMIAGFNGLEAGQGIIILSTITYFAAQNGHLELSLVSLIMIMALLAFLQFNLYPSRIFPGNILTYTIGGFIAIIAIMADIEKYAMILFIPYALQFFLKSRGKMKIESYAKVNEDGSLSKSQDKYYGIEHISIDVISKFKNKVYEQDVVHLIWAVQALIAIIDIVYFTL